MRCLPTPCCIIPHSTHVRKCRQLVCPINNTMAFLNSSRTLRNNCRLRSLGFCASISQNSLYSAMCRKLVRGALIARSAYCASRLKTREIDSESANLRQGVQPQPKVIRDSNPDLRINPYSDPDVVDSLLYRRQSR